MKENGNRKSLAVKKPARTLFVKLLSLTILYAAALQTPTRALISPWPAQPTPLTAGTYSPESSGQSAQDKILRTKIPDVELVNQNNKRVRFYTDLLKDKTVVISFIYTTCPGICTMQGRHLSRLQSLIGDRLGRDVYLISISKDPANDSPEKLKSWAEKFDAKPGWEILTGDPDVVAQLARLLAGDGIGKGEHSSAILIVNESNDFRERVYGLTSLDRLVKLINIAGKMPAATHGKPIS